MHQRKGLWRALYENLASLKTTVFVLLTLAACSLLGTLLPQGVAEEELQRQFSPGVTAWIQALGLNDLYHTNWFRFLLLLLCVNLIICTIERLPKTFKLLQRRDEQLSAQKLLKFSHSSQMSSRLPWSEMEKRLTETVSREFASVERFDTTEGFSGIAEKGRWSRWMVYVVHLSILLILFGALLGSLLGFKGFMNISEGEAMGEVSLYTGHQTVALPFQVRCDDFDATFYDTGAPKEFKSDLTVIDQGKEVHKQTIRVNDPMTYHGISFYQASYGSTLKEADVEFLDKDTGQSYRMTLPFHEAKLIPGTKDKAEIVNYQQDLSRFGPAVAIMVTKEGKPEPSGSWILVKVPEFHGNRIDNYQIKVTRAEPTQYTGLQVKQDPGIWLVYFGFIAMLTGIGLTFYSSHRKIWLWASQEKKSIKIIVAGKAGKNSLAFEREFNELCERVQEQLKSNEK